MGKILGKIITRSEIRTQDPSSRSRTLYPIHQYLVIKIGLFYVVIEVNSISYLANKSPKMHTDSNSNNLNNNLAQKKKTFLRNL